MNQQINKDDNLIKVLFMFFSALPVIIDNLNLLSIKSLGDSPIILFSMFIFLFVSFSLLLLKVLKVSNVKNIIITLILGTLIFIGLFIYKDFVSSDIYNIFLKLYVGKVFTVYGSALIFFGILTFDFLNEKVIEAENELYYSNINEKTKEIEAELKVINGIIAENEEKIKKVQEEETNKLKEENKQLREENKQLREETKKLKETINKLEENLK